MATFAQLGQLASGDTNVQSEFQRRVNYAMNVAAVQVYNEVITTPGHAVRAVFALKVLSGNYNLTAACFAVATNSTIAAEATVPAAGQPPAGNGIPDGDIQFAVNSVWNALAGA